MQTAAILMESPGHVSVRQLTLNPLQSGDVLVEIAWSGVSTGTEKLLWTGKMPSFPGMGYPLVPGYESVGRIVDAASDVESRIGEWVFVPGANCYEGARGLFGGSARRLVVPSVRVLPISEKLGRDSVLFALAATAQHAIAKGEAPDLIVGHGVLGRLLARLTIAAGAPAPTVWEIQDHRQTGASGYDVCHPDQDDRRDYRNIYDASGHAAGLDGLIGRLARGGEIVLAGFYDTPLSFAFPPAFMREAKLRVAAEWQPDDIASVSSMVASGALDLTGLVSDCHPAGAAETAYPIAFNDRDCLKLVLDWRDLS